MKSTERPGAAKPPQAQDAQFRIFVESVRDYAAAATQDAAMFRAFFHAMLEQGVHLPPSGYEAWFLSAAHDDRALQNVINALPAAAAAAGREGKVE